MASNRKYRLPSQLERCLATVSKIYQQANQTDLQAIVVNAKPRLQEESSYDNWNGGTAGHSLFLSLPEPLFLRTIARRQEIEETIRKDLESVHNTPNEFFEQVSLELNDAGVGDWREESGLLVGALPTPSQPTIERIWGDGFRVFLSHKSGIKKETGELKGALADFGISAFVAHQDIWPTEQWQTEIEAALATMQGFVALLTPDFRDSAWTDQEVGFAVGRGVPLVAVRMGKDPHGFIGRFQGLTADWTKAPAQIAALFIRADEAFATFVAALRRCNSWDQGNRMGAILAHLRSLDAQRAEALVKAYNDTSELRGAFAFNGRSPSHFGPGLVRHLERCGVGGLLYDTAGLIARAHSEGSAIPAP